MATRDKKRRRRLARRGKLEALARPDHPIPLISDLDATALEATAADEHESPEAEIAAAPDDGESSPTFKARAYTGGPMRPRMSLYTGGAPIVVDLKGVRAYRNGNKTPVLYSHDRDNPIGHTTSIDVSESIAAEGVLSVPGDLRDRVVGAARSGFRWAISIGLEASEIEYLGRDEKATVNGRAVKGPVYIARKGTLSEISFLAIGADNAASATVSASLDPASSSEPPSMDPQLRAHIEAAGFDPEELTDQQVEHFRQQHQAKVEAEQGGAGGPNGASGGAGQPTSGQPGGQGGGTATVEAAGQTGDPIEEERKRRAAEAERCHAVARICAQYQSPTIKIQNETRSLESVAIEAGWDTDKVELEAMRASRPAAPAAHSTGRGQTHTMEAVTAGLMTRAGVNVEAECFRGVTALEAGVPDWLRGGPNTDRFQQTMEHSRQFRSATMLEIAATAAEIESGQRPHGRVAVIEAAFSSGSFANLIGTTVGARALQAFNEVPDTTAGWTRRAEVPDFEAHDRVGLESMESLSHQPAGGEAAHAKVADWGESVQAARYSKQIVFDEQHMIGDRLDLLDRSPRQMGLAAARLIPDLVYFLLLDNPTMNRTGRAAFHSTDGTLVTAAAFDKDALQTMIASLMKQKDGDASLNLQPTHLITGTELADAVVQLTGSAIFTNDSGAGARNPLARYGITPIADARLSNGVTHPKTGSTASGSSTAYWLHSTQGEGIEVQTVSGTGGVPRVRTSNLTQGRWGIHIDVKHDVGAKMIENRTWRYNAGA